jgi:hypothetical protein
MINTMMEPARPPACLRGSRSQQTVRVRGTACYNGRPHSLIPAVSLRRRPPARGSLPCPSLIEQFRFVGVSCSPLVPRRDRNRLPACLPACLPGFKGFVADRSSRPAGEPSSLLLTCFRQRQIRCYSVASSGGSTKLNKRVLVGVIKCTRDHARTSR